MALVHRRRRQLRHFARRFRARLLGASQPVLGMPSDCVYGAEWREAPGRGRRFPPAGFAEVNQDRRDGVGGEGEFGRLYPPTGTISSGFEQKSNTSGLPVPGRRPQRTHSPGAAGADIQLQPVRAAVVRAARSHRRPARPDVRLLRQNLSDDARSRAGSELRFNAAGRAPPITRSTTSGTSSPASRRSARAGGETLDNLPKDSGLIVSVVAVRCRGYGYLKRGGSWPGNPIGGRSSLFSLARSCASATETIGVVPFLEGGNVYEPTLPDLGKGSSRYRLGRAFTHAYDPASMSASPSIADQRTTHFRSI